MARRRFWREKLFIWHQKLLRAIATGVVVIKFSTTHLRVRDDQLMTAIGHRILWDHYNRFLWRPEDAGDLENGQKTPFFAFCAP